MANDLYTKGANKIMQGQINLLTDTLKVAIVKSAYTPDLVNHEFLSDLGANALNSQTLASRTLTGRVLDAADTSFVVGAGETVAYVALYKDTGVAATSPLIALYDTITYFPFVTNGANVDIKWSDGAYKVLSL